MSWDTLVTGSVAFKSGTPENLKLKIIDELEEVLETTLEWDAKWQEYNFEDLNWTSHVSEEKIGEVYERWKLFFRRFSVSLYYLNEADYDEYAEDEDQDADSILESHLEELAEALESDEYDRANKVFEALIELLKAASVDNEVVSNLVARKINRLAEALEATETFGADKDDLMELLMELISVLEKMNVPTARLKKVLLVKAL